SADEDFRRATAFVLEHQRGLCPHVEEWRWGIDFAHPELGRVWDLNVLYLDESSEDVTASALAQEAERIMGARGAEHRRVWTTDGTVGARLAPGFRSLGWDVDVHVVMSYRRPPDRVADTTIVREVGATIWPSREKQLRSYPWTNDADIVAQMKTLYELTMGTGIARDFAVIEKGEATSFAFLFTRGGIGQIEDVATLEEYRDRGLSRAVVYHVLKESLAAGNNLTFLIADALDWPRNFYASLGFEPVGNHYFFLKTGEK
ncbi:MAG: GNAT family N-acetyltransferase, partial [Actinomycetota bacterium]